MKTYNLVSAGTGLTQWAVTFSISSVQLLASNATGTTTWVVTFVKTTNMLSAATGLTTWAVTITTALTFRPLIGNNTYVIREIDPGKFPSSAVFYFEACGRVIGGTLYFRLYNISDAAAVAAGRALCEITALEHDDVVDAAARKVVGDR